MQAIHTKHLGPTNHRGDRIRATCAAKRITLPWDYGLGVEENHHRAALILADMVGWTADRLVADRLVTGCMHDGSFCHVFAPRA